MLTDISPTNASMREPKRISAGRGARAMPDKVVSKKKARPNSLTVKPPQPEKVPK